MGHPPKLEETVEKLNKKVWMFGGALIGISGVVHWAIDVYRAVRGH